MSLLKEISPAVKAVLKNEWHPTRNEGIKFDDLSPGSTLKVWWLCSKNPKHEWQARFRNRATEGYGCHFCSGLKTLPEDSFAALHPKILAEWHPTRNVGIDPWKIAPKSCKRVWWRCNTVHHHEWQTAISSRVIYGSGCKQCSRIRNPLSKAAPEIAKEWHPIKNKPLTPDGVSAGSQQRVWWRCCKDPSHEWQTQVGTRVKAKTRCPHCAKLSPQRKPQPLDTFKPVLAAQWHPTKNNGRLPSDFFPSSRYKAWWICPVNSSHVWQAIISNRSKFNHGCPFCAPRSSRMSPGRSLPDHFPEIAKEWHPTKNTLKASEVMFGSSKRVWWRCKANPAHEWEATVTARTQKRTRSQCPHCSGFYVSSANSLQAKRPDIAKEWHPTKNLPLTPDKIKKASGRKVWWQCSVNPSHEWPAIVKNRTILGNGCPYCAPFHSAELNTNYIETFKNDIRALRALSKQEPPKIARLRQALLRMLYSSAITVLETYLSDAFYQTVIKDEVLIERLMLTTPEFNDKKYSLSELVEWRKLTNEKVSEYLFNIVWHNLSKVRCMYRDVLGVKFPDDSGAVHVAVVIRHDIVHRGGKTKSGRPHNFRESDIEKLYAAIEAFVTAIDLQVKARKAQN